MTWAPISTIPERYSKPFLATIYTEGRGEPWVMFVDNYYNAWVLPPYIKESSVTHWMPLPEPAHIPLEES